jgi:hypothetical protein
MVMEDYWQTAQTRHATNSHQHPSQLSLLETLRFHDFKTSGKGKCTNPDRCLFIINAGSFARCSLQPSELNCRPQRVYRSMTACLIRFKVRRITILINSKEKRCRGRTANGNIGQRVICTGYNGHLLEESSATNRRRVRERRFTHHSRGFHEARDDVDSRRKWTAVIENIATQ